MIRIFQLKKTEIEDVVSEVEKYESCIIFIDDLSYLFRFNDFVPEDEASAVKQKIMKSTDLVKNSQKRILLFITANHLNSLDESIVDRIEEPIEVEIPSEENKLNFLKHQFGDILNGEELRLIAQHSIGYNYRDLSEIVKRGYRKGNGIIDKSSIEKAMKDYVPTALSHLKVLSNITTNFNSLVGRKDLKSSLRNVVVMHKKHCLSQSPCL